MTNLKDTAQAYEAPRVKNVADLPYISIDMEIHEESEVEYPYKYVQVDGERYKINNSVIADVKEILAQSPQIAKFKVLKKGEGMKTKYTVLPLM